MLPEERQTTKINKEPTNLQEKSPLTRIKKEPTDLKEKSPLTRIKKEPKNLQEKRPLTRIKEEITDLPEKRQPINLPNYVSSNYIPPSPSYFNPSDKSFYPKQQQPSKSTTTGKQPPTPDTNIPNGGNSKCKESKTMMQASNKNNTCIFCLKKMHKYQVFCSKLKKLRPQEIKKVMNDNNIECNRCLGLYHKTDHCNWSIKCDVVTKYGTRCGKLHTAVLHEPRSDLEKKKYKCPLTKCQKYHLTWHQLKRHLRKIHNWNNENYCQECRIGYNSWKTLLDHYKFHHECHQPYQDNEETKTQQADKEPRYANVVTNIFQCDLCGTRGSQEEMESHMEYHRRKSQAYQCDKCQQKFIDKLSVINHIHIFH